MTDINDCFSFRVPPFNSLYIWLSLCAWYSSTMPKYGRKPSIDFVSRPNARIVALVIFAVISLL